MPMPLEDALSADLIRQALPPLARDLVRELTVLGETDSTNAVLARLPPDRRHAHAVLAEAQTRGRGRRQRHWYSPAGGNIYLSLGWRFEPAPPHLTTLPLVAGVCACRALERAGLRSHGVKWPNDILVNGAKLAGILVETLTAAGRAVLAVIGIGLNVRMPGGATGLPAGAVDRPWTDLASQLPAAQREIGRNALAALLLEELLSGLERYAAEGFEPFREDWNRRDLLAGKRVGLEGNGPFPSGMAHSGTALGIDEGGGLVVDIDGYGAQVLHAAEVSILDA
ncbi:MAG: biotin--[acetyl-CoA-carboxylase] ligase [Lysobacterales bacterium]|nr:MAG: biotin--[acetyl-CoA-carboxylase] ligase [Xanthomonadales bacterium]